MGASAPYLIVVIFIRNFCCTMLIMNKDSRFQNYKLLEKDFNIEYDKPLVQYTTWKLGGNAEAFVKIKTSKEFIDLFTLIYKLNLDYFILGGGSNILISDNGVKKLVVKNEVSDIQFQEEVKVNFEYTNDKIKVLRSEDHWKKGFLSFSDLDYDDYSDLKTRVVISSGTILQKAINTSLDHKLSGLQWFSGIPGTIGGAIYNNIHGGSKHFSENVEWVDILLKGKIERLSINELKFGYDYSILHEEKFPVLSVGLLLNHFDPEKAKQTAIEWTKRKTVQPRNSCGSVFKNLTKEQAEIAGLENLSVGFLIDTVLMMKGYKYKGVQVFENHANFIVNNGEGKSQDVFELVKLIKDRAKNEVGVVLDEEFIYIGFEDAQN